MNVSGHRLSTTEIESALVSHPKVAEAAVVGANDETTGQAVVAFVILRAGSSHADDDNTGIVEELRNHVAKEIGPIAKPARSSSFPSCPRPAPARSCAACCATSPRVVEVGDVTTLADTSVMDLIKTGLSSGSDG
jgi:acetyl-CoA synthetase